MFYQLTQFLTNFLNGLQQLVGISFGFVLIHSVFFISLLLGVFTFLFLMLFIQPVLVSSDRKRYFQAQHKMLSNADNFSPEEKKVFWKKYPLLTRFYTTYQWANLPFTYEFFLLTLLGLFLIVIFIGLILGFFWGGILGGVTLTYAYILVIKILARKNYQKISGQLPFVLETLSSSVQSGFSLSQALKFTADEVEMPFKLIFTKMLAQMNYNIPLGDVFLKAQKDIKNQEFKMVLDGLIMQDKMGGNIVQMLQRMADWVRQKNKLEKDIKVFTSQGRLSGIIIALLWPLSATIFYFLNAEYISILFTNNTGQIFLFLSMVLEIIGFMMIWKIIKIKI
jgi:tight adherence protein B